MNQPLVFLDADVIFAGAASPIEYSASQLVLQTGQWGLLACRTSEQAAIESERNIALKVPSRLMELRAIIKRALTIVPDPAQADLDRYSGFADPKDLPILVSGIQSGCPRLLSFNVRHYWPPPALIAVQRPGDLVRQIRTALAGLDDTSAANP